MAIDDRAEWIETDGLGGFASGTVSGIRTRRYHAVLLSAMTPPTGRVVLVNGFDACVRTATGSFPITTQRYAPDVLHPDGATRIAVFMREPWPTWEFELPEGIKLQFPTGRIVLPDGSLFLEGHGVQPTVRVPIDEKSVLSSDDAVLKAAEAELTK